MHLNRTFIAAAASAALVFGAIPADAQRRGDDHAARRGGDTRAQSQSQSRDRSAPAPRASGREPSRPTAGRSYAVPRGGTYNRSAEAARPNAAPSYSPSYSRGSYSARDSYRSQGNYRSNDAYRGDRGRRYDYGRSYNYRGNNYYRGGYGYGGGYHPSRSFFSYYLFRPRISLGFGLWMGYPIAYPDYYGYYTPDVYVTPAPYPSDSYAYGSQPPSSAYGYQAEPPAQQGDPSDASAPGGVSFDITPASAAVFVDGTYVGTADTFGPSGQPLGLVPGQHRIELRAEGYRTMTFDADVVAGQVIPYRGTLSR